MSAPRRRRCRARFPGRRRPVCARRRRAAGQRPRPRDVIEWRLWTDEADVDLEVDRSGLSSSSTCAKRAGQPLGAEVSSAVFDRVRTCDNHCEFCFIYQLPKGMRRSLYLKDDDYRLSFLYGNFTTLTRFTEADLERVVTERLSPLHVSIHSTDPDLRARMLRNPRGATSLRWLRALLDHGIEVRGQIVVCPGVNDGAALDDTLAGVLDEYPELARWRSSRSGSRSSTPRRPCAPHTLAEARAVVDAVEDWQDVYEATLGRPLVHAADEYYLMADRPFPPAERYDGFPMHEDGIGMARTFELEFTGARRRTHGHAARLLRRRRRRDAAAEPGGLHRIARPPGRRPGHDADPAGGTDRHPLRRARRPGARPAGRAPRPRRRADRSRYATSSSAATPA